MKYRALFIISFLNLLYERAWSSFWPAFSLVFLYTALALFNVTAMFGETFHAVLLALFACAVLRALARPFTFPRTPEVERRMERASAVAHRPLAALQDT